MLMSHSSYIRYLPKQYTINHTTTEHSISAVIQAYITHSIMVKIILFIEINNNNYLIILFNT